MYEDGKRKNTVMWFDSAKKAWDVTIPEHNKTVYQEAVLDADRGESWLGVDGDYKAVRNLVEDSGWEEGFKRADETFGYVEPIKLPSLKRKRRKGPVGGRLDIHQVYAGRLQENRCYYIGRYRS
jgi:hypothetical protein